MANPAVKLEALLFEASFPALPLASSVAATGTSQSSFDGQVEQDGETRPVPAGHDAVERMDQAAGDSSSMALVGQRGVRESVTNHDSSCFEGRPDDLPQMLRSVRKVESHLDLRDHSPVGRVQQNLANLTADPRAARLSGEHAGPTDRLQTFSKELGLSGFATTLDAFESYQETQAARPTRANYHNETAVKSSKIGIGGAGGRLAAVLRL